MRSTGACQATVCVRPNGQKKIFMSSPARAEGYESQAQQREDSTIFMVANV